MAQGGSNAGSGTTPEIKNRNEREVTRTDIEETGYRLYCQKMDLEQRIRDIRASSPSFDTSDLEADKGKKEAKIRELANNWADEKLWLAEFHDPHQAKSFERMLAEKYRNDKIAKLAKSVEGTASGKATALAKSGRKQITLATDVKGAEVARDAEGSLVMAAQNLLEATPPLNLDDLISGNRREDAIRAVFPNEMATTLISDLSDPLSPKYQETLKTLVAFKATLTGPYKDLKALYTAKDQVTGSTIDGYAKGKLGSVLEEVKSHPGQSWAAGICILGALAWAKWGGGEKSEGGSGKGFLSKIGKAVPWLLGIAGVTFGADLLSKGALRSGLGLTDGFEKLFGTRPDVLITPEILERVRASIKGDKLNNDAVDDLLTIIPVSAVSVAEAFEAAVPYGKKIDKNKFAGQIGIKAMKQLEGDDLYMACDWAFYECGKIALAEDNAPSSTGMSREDIALEGAKYVEKRFPGRSFGALLIELKLLIDTKAAQKGKEAVKTRNENRITDTHLAGLAEQFPSFRSVLRSTGEPEVYRIKGYPFKYYFNEKGEHEFKDCLNEDEAPVIFKDNLSKDTLNSLLSKFADQGEKRMNEEFKLKFSLAGRVNDALAKEKKTVDAGDIEKTFALNAAIEYLTKNSDKQNVTADDVKSYVIDTASANKPKIELGSNYGACIDSAFNEANTSPVKFESSRYELEYVETSGFYKFTLPLESNRHNGLPGYKPQPIPVIVYADTKGLHLGLDAFKDFEPDSSEVPYNSAEALQEAYDKQVVIKNLVEDTAGHLLSGIGYEIASIEENDSGSAGVPATIVTISYGRAGLSTAKFEYSNDKLTKVLNITETPELTALWKAQAETKTAAFFEREDVQRKLVEITPEFGSWTDKTKDFFSDIGSWATEDGPETRVRNEREKALVEKVRGMMETMPDDYINSVFKRTIVSATSSSAPTVTSSYSYSPDSTDFAGREKSFFDSQLATIDTQTKAPVQKSYEGPDFVYQNWEEVQPALNDKISELRGMLQVLEYENPTDSLSWMKTALLAPWNAIVKRDATRMKLADTKIDGYVKEFSESVWQKWNNVDAAGEALAGGTAETMTKSNLDALAKTIMLKAHAETAGYLGADDKTAIREMTLDPLRGANFANWKDATELVSQYLTGNVKWEAYAMLPKPENMVLVMQLWYKNIKDSEGKLPAASPESAKKYAEYFIWNVYTTFGSNQDWSLDRLYNNGTGMNSISSASDSDVTASLAGFEANTLDYATYFGNNEPAVPTLKGASLEGYCNDRREKFMKWFNKHADCGALAKLDSTWPEIYQLNVERRLDGILALAKGQGKSTADVYALVQRLQLFVLAERWNLFELFISHGVEPRHRGDFVELNILNNFNKFFGGTNMPDKYAEMDPLQAYIDYLLEATTAKTHDVHDGLGPLLIFPHGFPIA